GHVSGRKGNQSASEASLDYSIKSVQTEAKRIWSRLKHAGALAYYEMSCINGFILRRSRPEGIWIWENARLFETVKRK
ncbi:2-dehydropantoate 2-reductase, partial [Escherichia coli]|nr:2-dehydropantoate 2-reductase [Escherichia coli]